jgi:hypothetical protein
MVLNYHAAFRLAVYLVVLGLDEHPSNRWTDGDIVPCPSLSALCPNLTPGVPCALSRERPVPAIALEMHVHWLLDLSYMQFKLSLRTLRGPRDRSQALCDQPTTSVKLRFSLSGLT